MDMVNDFFYYNFKLIFIIIFIITYSSLIFSYIFILKQKRKRNNKIKLLKEDLKLKIDENFNLTIEVVKLLGFSYELSSENSRYALYSILKEMKHGESFERTLNLIKQFEEENPFDYMPDEVKPSLFRISELISQAGYESDKHILNPIITLFTQYNELVIEQKRSKKQTTFAFWITIISFLVSIISFYYAATAPNSDEIADKLNEKLFQGINSE